MAIDGRMAMAYERNDARREVLPTNKARQGITGHNVRYVLLLSLGGALVALAVIYLVFFV